MDGVRIGTSGWTYDHWAGRFYPGGLARARWRDFYASRFDTVELNASFYRWPGIRPFQGWARSLPDGFALSVKASRWLSHGRRLNDPEGAWADRLTAAARALGDRAGVVLVQLPGDLERDGDTTARLDAFLARMPADVKVAMELRHPSWDGDEVAAMLEKHGSAYVVTHGTGLHTVLRATAPFVYCRWHGPTDRPLYAGRYSAEALQEWADRIRAWRAEGREVWGYFDNDGSGYAPENARELLDLLG
ncbi:Uncharacterized conserved protein YecE, DUF72 family [Nocardioides terrae]|uniref:Uncharacterized conserved protein YecE, DUF72 family n=1 Tax=Nocardioides terrae TaxID=574651 RepID=A0A1I1MPH6_9ACTN|nr:DUF72 domain-containing protein [Nocardioides terrae]SFC87261.1 Uncharacterized conserved protein YecE, DUF72 family [Nocardioides terrae]